MFSKSASSPSQPAQPTPQPASPTSAHAAAESVRAPQRPQRGSSLIGAEMVFEGDISGGGEVQVDGTIKGDVRVEHVTIGESGQVEGGIYAEAVEVRGRVVGAITAKQVRLYGACHVDGDITHEQLAMETGSFFQGRSLRLQRQPTAVQAPATARPEVVAGPREVAPPAPRSASAA